MIFRGKSDYDRWYNLLVKSNNRNLMNQGFAQTKDKHFWDNVGYYTALIEQRIMYRHYRLEPIVTAIMLTGIVIGLTMYKEEEVHTMSKITENVNRIIQDKGLNPDDIARMVGITVKNFRQMLDGRKALPTRYIIPLCNALQVTPNELFGM